MRLRNIPRAEEVLGNSDWVIKNAPKLRGLWKTDIFHNDAPIHIEIGMGKGQFLLTLAKEHPEINYIGIERYASVLLRAVEQLEQTDAVSQPQNVRFLCVDARELPDIFQKDEVSRIYLNFSDPWPKVRHAKRRLTSGEFLSRYEQFLDAKGRIEFKTDNRELFDFSLSEVRENSHWVLDAFTFDLHEDVMLNFGNIMTEYEEKFSSMGKPICKLIAHQNSVETL